MNKKTVALDQQQYKTIISTIRSGFVWNNHSFKPNELPRYYPCFASKSRLRISDILQLHTKTLSKMAAGTALTYASKRPAKSEHLPLYLTSITISCDTQRTMGSIAKPNSLTYQTELCKSNSKSYVII